MPVSNTSLDFAHAARTIGREVRRRGSGRAGLSLPTADRRCRSFAAPCQQRCGRRRSAEGSAVGGDRRRHDRGGDRHQPTANHLAPIGSAPSCGRRWVRGTAAAFGRLGGHRDQPHHGGVRRHLGLRALQALVVERLRAQRFHDERLGLRRRCTRPASRRRSACDCGASNFVEALARSTPRCTRRRRRRRSSTWCASR